MVHMQTHSIYSKQHRTCNTWHSTCSWWHSSYNRRCSTYKICYSICNKQTENQTDNTAHIRGHIVPITGHTARITGHNVPITGHTIPTERSCCSRLIELCNSPSSELTISLMWLIALSFSPKSAMASSVWLLFSSDSATCEAETFSRAPSASSS